MYQDPIKTRNSKRIVSANLDIADAGGEQVHVTILADSIHPKTNKRITTFELEYPRFILSELNTHAMLCKNSMSSRAVPVKTMLEQVCQNPAMPVRFGQNKPGMQDHGSEHDNLIFEDYMAYTPRRYWVKCAREISEMAQVYADHGYHKQIANRLIEPFQRMKTVLTATEFANFFHLRNHSDADPTFAELAAAMQGALIQSEPRTLKFGQWHAPYYANGVYDPSDEVSLADALAISVSCCAQVSYRRNDASLEKARSIFKKLLSDARMHASPFQHQATPIDYDSIQDTWPLGVSHQDKNGRLWSAQFQDFIMYRKTFENESVQG